MWKKSYELNCECAETAKKLIGENYHDYCLNTNQILDDLINEYGIDRVNLVLANTIRQNAWDGRIAVSNKLWAANIRVPDESQTYHHNVDYMIHTHPGFVNMLSSDMQKRTQNLVQENLDHQGMNLQ